MESYVRFLILCFMLINPALIECDKLDYNGTNLNVLYDVNFCELNSTERSVDVDILKAWDKFPKSFIPDEHGSRKCLSDSRRVRLAANRLELWALKMFDSSAKLPSGILSGNINQYGDYDQCLGIDSPIGSQYCLASVDVSFKHLSPSDEIDDRIHTHYFIKNKLTDHGHRVPKVSTIYWGVCMPSSCSASDLESTMNQSLTGLSAKVLVDQHLCITNHRETNISNGKIITISLFAVLLLCIARGTYIDLYGDITSEPSVLINFSLRKNVKSLVNVDSKEEIKGLDGVKALNAFGLLVSHKSMSLFYNPYINRVYLSEYFSTIYSVVGRTAIIYTDSFLLISGLLSVRGFLTNLSERGRLGFADKFTSRLFRLMPNLITLILFCTYVLPELSGGPLWGLVINEHARLCEKNMWKNFLLIHNYMGFENMCLTHTHQLGIDTQLFLASPIAALILWKYSTKGLMALFSIAAASSVLRYAVTMSRNVSMVVYFGKSINQFWESANYSYILPTHRATIYIIGIAMAYLLSANVKKLQLTKINVYWMISLCLGMFSAIGPVRMVFIGYKYNVNEAAFYNTVLPITWGVWISWIIWSCNNDCGGLFGEFLMWRGFKIFGKISYAVYLTQFPIFFYNVGTRRHSDHFNTFEMYNVLEFLFVLVVSAMLTVCVEMPFVNIYKKFFGEKKTMNKSNGVKRSINNNKLD